MDPKHGAGAGVSPELSALQAQLREKDRLIESLERESERHRVVRETEDQLMTTAFYNLVGPHFHFGLVPQCPSISFSEPSVSLFLSRFFFLKLSRGTMCSSYS